MIVIDTHVWVWWVHEHPKLEPWMRQYLGDQEGRGIGVSVISCWEIARLVSLSRLKMTRPLAEWFDMALAYPGVNLIDLTPAISIESSYLPGDFHKDPADRIIVATARTLNCPLLTADARILEYPGAQHVVRP